MNASTLPMNLATAQFSAPVRPVSTARTVQPAVARHPATPTRSLTELTQECLAESASVDRVETASLLFLGGCALAFIAGCGLHLERFVSDWASFEAFVRALVG